MDIVCSPDKNYVMPTGIMMCSLCENNKDEEITFHIIHADLNEEEKNSLTNIAKRYGKEICFYTVEVQKLADITTIGQNQQRNLPLSAYYRLLFVDLLPKHIEKVLYLDGDTIVSANLTELWNTDIEDYALAAVIDYTLHERAVAYNRLRYPFRLGYFNSGVLLINVSYWRQVDATNLFLDFIKKHPEGLANHDQDVLNYIFCKKKKFIHIKYNLQQGFLLQPEYRLVSWEYEEEIEDAARHPVIIHYNYRLKPWYKDCEDPYKDEFLKYKALTEWKDTPLKRIHRSKLEYIKGFVKKILVHFHLMEAKPIPEWAYTYNDLIQNKQ